MSGTTSSGLSLDALVGSLKTSESFTDVSNKVQDLKKAKEQVKAPLPKVTREKIEREVAYGKESEQVGNWTSIVKANRETKQLRFNESASERPRVTPASLSSKFAPSNSMEKEIEVILQVSGMNEKTILKKESDELKEHQVSKEDMQKRLNDLRQMKQLLFYSEQKQKRMNKIKSKKYRSIKKREKLRKDEKEKELRREADPDYVEAEEEEEERKRVEERISLKHKNTSKWIRRQLQHGMQQQDQSVKDAINEQLREGEKLSKKIESRHNHSEDSDSDIDSDMDTNGYIHKTEDLLSTIQDENQPHQGIFKMKFMQKALERQRQEAKTQAHDLLNELEQEKRDEEEAFNSTDNSEDEEEINENEQGKQKSIKEFNKDVEAIKTIASNDQVIRRKQNANQKTISVNGFVSTHAIDTDSKESELDSLPEVTIHSDLSDNNNDDDNNDDDNSDDESEEQFKVIKNNDAGAHIWNFDMEDEEEQEEANSDDNDNEDVQTSNPWLSTSSHHNDIYKENKNDKHKEEDIDMMKILSTIDNEQEKKNEKKKKKNTKKADKTKEENKESIDETNTNQDQDKVSKEIKQKEKQPIKGVLDTQDDSDDDWSSLIHQAFADADVDEEFAHEKEQEIEEEERWKKSKEEENIPNDGWGSWAGEGVTKSERKPKKITPKEESKIEKKPYIPDYTNKFKKLKNKKENSTKPKEDEDEYDEKRKDETLSNVIISTKKDKKASKYILQDVPYPFTSRAQYERAMRQPLGKEWNTASRFHDLTRPDIKVRRGFIIDPIKMTEGDKKRIAEEPKNNKKTKKNKTK